MKLPSSPRAKLATWGVALALTGCGEEAAEAKLQGPLTWSKGGGIAGLRQQLTIRTDWSATATNRGARRAFTVRTAERRAVEQAVRAADLAHARSPRDRGAADAFHYGLRYRGHSVVWSDVSDDPPRRVQRLYDMLARLYERYAPRG